MRYEYVATSITTMALLLTLLLVVPLTSFTLPSATQRRFRVGRHVGGLSNSDLVEEVVPVTMMAVEEESTEATAESQPMDIIRDLDGNPLSTEYFALTMGIPVAEVDSYSCPEEDAFRGLMSKGCRVRLIPGGQTAFYKHIVFEGLDHAQVKLKKSPHKLKRDAQSYQVVASFLQSQACQSLTETTGVQIPRCYDVQSQPNWNEPMLSKFSFLFEDLSPSEGWYQQWLLDDLESCQAALSTFARIHAYFWHGSDFWKDADKAQELEEGIWKSGSYVQPTKQGRDQWREVRAEWKIKRMKFQHELSSLEFWDNLGERLESVAEECGRVAHPFADDDALSTTYQQYRTFTHGDPKQANLLFRTSSSSTTATDPTESKPLPQMGLLDFQWSGFGLAATDTAHFITSAVHADQLIGGGEERLLKYYFEELQTHLVEYGAYRDAEEAAHQYGYELFLEQYEVGVLDLCRLIIAYTWERFTEPVDKDDDAGCARTMNKTSYNKSVPNVVWLLTRCDEILKSRGV